MRVNLLYIVFVIIFIAAAYNYYFAFQTTLVETPLVDFKPSATVTNINNDYHILTRPSDDGHSGDVTFKGATSFVRLLREAHKRKMANPLPHCRHDSKKPQIRIFNRAIQVDWIGRNVSSVEPTWSVSGTASCQFAALAFPPTGAVLERALQQKIYVSSFYNAGQCGYNGKGGLRWNKDEVRKL